MMSRRVVIPAPEMRYDLTNAFPNITQLSQGLYIAQDSVSSFTNAFGGLESVGEIFDVSIRGDEADYVDMFPVLVNLSGDIDFVLDASPAGAVLPSFLNDIVSVTYGGVDNFTITATNLDARTNMPTFPFITYMTGDFNFINSTLVPTHGGQPWDGAFPALTNCGAISVTIGGLTSLQSFMPMVTSATSVTLISMSLSNGYVAGLANVTGSFASLTQLNYLSLSSLDLTDFGVFSGLSSVVYLQVIYNDLLTDISALESLDGAQLLYAEVSLNPVLPTLSQVFALNEHYISEGFTGTFNQSGNGPG